jgi:hypothetical protein
MFINKKIVKGKCRLSKCTTMKTGYRRIYNHDLLPSVGYDCTLVMIVCWLYIESRKHPGTKSRRLVKCKVQISKSNLKPGANTTIHVRIPKSMYKYHNPGANTTIQLIIRI